MKLRYIELLGRKYPLCFSLSATEEIIAEFGSTENMGESLAGKDTAAQLKAVDIVLDIMLRAGERYCKAAGLDVPPPLNCRPADVMDISVPSAIQTIFSVINGDSERTIEAKGKNV